jgi:hypothetical protein
MPPTKPSQEPPPNDEIREDSGPPLTAPKNKKPGQTQVDVDDAMIEEPRDDAFDKKDPAPPEKHSSR